MRKIKDLKVVVSSSVSNFEDSLKEQINNMQRQGHEVAINNPHSIKLIDNKFKYIAVVEGHETTADCSFPPFNINPTKP